MLNPCIAVDISMESSHMLGFYDFNKKVTAKPQVIPHTLSGFNVLLNLFNKIKKETNIEPIIVFEYTGVYHKTLQLFLDDNNIQYHMIHPTKSSKHRQNKDNPIKTDSLDCINLAEMYYENNMGIFYKRSELYQNLKELDTYYQSNKEILQELEVTLCEKLAVIYPLYKTICSDILSENSLKFLFKFPHPKYFTNYNKDQFIEWYMNNCNHSYNYSLSQYNKILDYTNSIYSGCKENSIIVQSMIDTIFLIVNLLDIQQSVKEKLIALASNDKNFEIICSIPNIGKLTAARLIAEYGEISRFSTPKKMNKYAGINPCISQSGKLDGKHISISKKGNSILREVLFLAVRSMIKKDSKAFSIRNFYLKKKAQPRIHPKVALVATMNKFNRTLYSLCKKGTLYDPSQL